jgi:integrase
VLPSELQGWVSDRAKVLAPSTLRQVVGLVRSVYSAAVVDRLVTSSPATRLTLPSMHRERVVPLTVDQVRALAAVMAPHYWAMVIAQAALGLRLGELLALRVDDVDFLRRTVRVEHQVAQKSRELVPPKTPRSKRTVPLPKVVAEALAAHLAAFPATAPVGCDCPKMVTCSRSMSGLLFHTSTDHPLWHEHYGTRVFATAVKRAKLPAGTTSHDLRHLLRQRAPGGRREHRRGR